jgi:hypothetical protein
MKGVRFYLEHSSPQAKRKGEHAGTVVAVFHEQGWFERQGDRMQYMHEAVGGVFERPNSPVASTAVARSYLAENCKRIPESEAREIHPALFEYLDRED